MTAISFATFMPLMLTGRGMSVSQAGTAVAIYLFASGLGGFFGGPTADRFGARKVIALSLVFATPFLVVAPFLSGWPFVVVLALGGFFLQSTLPVNVTFAQALAPVSAATVSSIMMGSAGAPAASACARRMIAVVGIEPTLGPGARAAARRPRCRFPRRALYRQAGRSAVAEADISPW
jgi:MFS family permease